MNLFSFFDSIARAWLEAATRASVQGGILLLLVAAVCFALKAIPPSLKCWLWRLAVLKLLISFAVVPLIPVTISSFSRSPGEVRHFAPLPGLLPSQSSFSQVAVTPTVSKPAQSMEKRANTVAPVHLLFTLWIMVACLLGCRFFFHWRKASLLRNSSQPAPPELQALLDSIATRFAVPPPPLRLSSRTRIPLITGLWNPVVILPENLLPSLSRPQLSLILAHELAHLRRHDLLWNTLGSMTQILFFFHPLLWLGLRENRLLQEISADQLALAKINSSEKAYASLLLGFCAKQNLLPALVLPMLTPGGPLKRRLLALKSCREPVTRMGLGLSICILLVIASFLPPWKLTAQDDTPVQNAPESQPQRPISRSADLSSRLEQQRLYQQEIELARKALEVGLRRKQHGVASFTETIELERDVVRLERELARFNDDLEGYRKSIQQEITLLENFKSELEKAAAAGRESPTALWKVDRELLRLKRDLAAASERADASSVSDARPIQLSPARAGVVTRVLVNQGQSVQAGEKLLELDDREARIQVRAAEASVTAAKAALSAASSTRPEPAPNDPGILLAQLRSLDKEKLREVLPTVHRDATLERLLGDLASTEQKWAELSLQYTEDHPSVRGLVAQLKKLNDAIDQRINGILVGLTTLEDARAAARDQQAKYREVNAHKNAEGLRAELQLREANLEGARLQLELCTLTAPVSGTIQRILVQPGERATLEQPAILLVPGEETPEP